MGNVEVSVVLMVSPCSSGDSREPLRQVDSNGSKIFTTSDSDLGLAEDNLPMVVILQDIISLKRMQKLVLRYGVPLGYVYKVFNDDMHISTLGPLKVVMYEDRFCARFHLRMHHFIKTFLSKYI